MDDVQEREQETPYGFSAPVAAPIGTVSDAPKWLPVEFIAPHPDGYTSTFDNLPGLAQLAPAPEERRDPHDPFSASHGSEEDVMEGWNPRNPIPNGSWDPTGEVEARTDFAPPTGLPATLAATQFPPPSMHPNMPQWAPTQSQGTPAVDSATARRMTGESSRATTGTWAPPQHQVTHTGAADPYSANAARIARPGAAMLPPTGDPYQDRMRGLQAIPPGAGTRAWAPPGTPSPHAGWPQPPVPQTGWTATPQGQPTGPMGSYPAWQQQGYPTGAARPVSNAALVSPDSNVFTLLGWGLIYAVMGGVIWPDLWVISLFTALLLAVRVPVGGATVRMIFRAAALAGVVVWFIDQGIRNGSLDMRYDFAVIAMRVVLIIALAASFWVVITAKSALLRQPNY